MKHFIALVLIAAFGVSSGCGETPQTQPSLTDRVELTPLPVLAHLIVENKTLKWPELTSNASQALNQPTSPKSSILGNALLEKIRNYEGSTSRELESSLKACEVYAELSRGLQESNGYVNVCLADAVNCLIISRLMEILVKYPSSSERVRAILEKSDCLKFSTRTFLKMIHDEHALNMKAGVDLNSLDEKTLESRILASVDITEDEIVSRYGLGKAKTSNLINDLEVGVLLYRMGQNDVAANVDMAGLLEFLRRGGKLNQINAHDERPFRIVMNGAEDHFKSDLMGTRLTFSSLVQMISFANNSRINPMLKNALE